MHVAQSRPLNHQTNNGDTITLQGIRQHRVQVIGARRTATSLSVERAPARIQFMSVIGHLANVRTLNPLRTTMQTPSSPP